MSASGSPDPAAPAVPAAGLGAATVEIAEIRAARAAMTSLPWVSSRTDDMTVEGDAAHQDGPVEIAFLTGEAMSGDGPGIVAIVNAVDVLLEIVELDLIIQLEDAEFMRCLVTRDAAIREARGELPRLNARLQEINERVAPLMERRAVLLSGVKL